MQTCVRCRLNLPDEEFLGGSKGRSYLTCMSCRNSSPAAKKRICAGVKGRKKCTAEITDYRCPACWKLVRAVDLGAHHTEDDFGGAIHSANW